MRINNIKLSVYRDKFKTFLAQESTKRTRQASSETKQENQEKHSQYIECKSLDSEFTTSVDEKSETHSDLNTSSSSSTTSASSSGNSMNVFNSDLDLNIKNSRHRSHSSNSSTSSEASSEKPIPSPFIVDEDDNVSSLSGGLEYWLALGGKLLGVEKGNYLKSCVKSMTIKSLGYRYKLLEKFQKQNTKLST